MPLITCFSYIIIRNSTFLVIVLNSYPILELIGTDMKHKIINLKKSGILIMAVFAMVTTLCARPLMAFADGDDTYWPEQADKCTMCRGDGGQYGYGAL